MDPPTSSSAKSRVKSASGYFLARASSHGSGAAQAVWKWTLPVSLVPGMYAISDAFHLVPQLSTDQLYQSMSYPGMSQFVSDAGYFGSETGMGTRTLKSRFSPSACAGAGFPDFGSIS